MKNIEFSNCMQVIGIIGILPNRVCGRARNNKLMDLQFSNNLPSEVYFWGEIVDVFHRAITLSGTEMLKWFNHRSVDNSIFFFVGRNFPKLVVCIVPGPLGFHGFVEISINGYENREYQSIDLMGDPEYSCSQYLFSLTQWSLLQRHLNESNPTDQNRVKVSIRYKSDDTCYSIKMWGVHLECTCPPQEDDAVDYGYSIKMWGVHVEYTCPPQESDDDDVGDYWRKLPFFDFFPSKSPSIFLLLQFTSHHFFPDIY